MASGPNSNDANHPGGPAAWLGGGGEMGKVVRAKDWSQTPLGPLESWPQSLRTTISLCLSSNFPISIAWGPEHIQIYNDGYWPICGDKHPHAMGMDFSRCWASAWPAIGAAFESALAGTTAFLENQRMFLDRYGFLEETFFTFSFSPIHDENGVVAGIFHPVTEVTGNMLNERRTRSLRDLAGRTGNAQRIADALRLAATVLSDADLDVPFALFYEIDDAGQTARLMAQTGLPPGAAPSPLQIELAAPSEHAWPLAEVVSSQQPRQLDDLGRRFGGLVCGPYPEPLQTALLLPISSPGMRHAAAVLIAGVSSRLPLSESYRAHYDLLAGVVTAAVSNARAYAEERRRAEALAEIDRAKTAFFSNISHELRTPLTLILGPLGDELDERDSPLPEPRRERLATAHRNSTRLLKLVNSLLDFSRAEANRTQASYRPSNLGGLTVELVSMFRAAVEKGGVTLEVSCPPLPEAVLVDHEMWEKIVLNLLSNAFKHTFKGHIRVALRAIADRIELTVADSGVGIPAAELASVFERFHQVKGARSRSHEGSGIGLALVKELVRLHGGDITVASVEGEGTTFTVTLRRGAEHLPADRVIAARSGDPASIAATAYVQEAMSWLPDEPAGLPLSAADTGATGPQVNAAFNAAATGNEASAPAASMTPLRQVLWVDDNADMRAYVQRLLAPHYAVTTAVDGLAALEAARAARPDLVLSDVMMPRLDGFGLLRELRADERTRTVPVILLSARAGEESALEGLSAGADDYLIKPFSARELLTRIRTHLELAERRSEWARTLEIANHQLATALTDARAAREEAIGAAQAKSEFLAAMSHEIRTPLSAVLGFAGLLADTELTPPQQELVAVLRSSGDHLLGIINDVLDFSKLQSGHFTLVKAPFQPRRTVTSALAFVMGRAAEKDLQLRWTVAPDVPLWLEADEPRLRQILINYLSNAVKFTERGAVTVHVEAPARGDSGLRDLHFSVRDSGPGIPPERMPLLFQEFSQGDPSIAAKYGGTGLGLVICKRLAELHGGRAWGESQVGTGSVFHVVLPVPARTDITATVATVSPATLPVAPVTPLGRAREPGLVSSKDSERLEGRVRPLTILLAEDKEINQRLAKALIGLLGYRADVVSDGRAVLTALERKRYDVILMDMQMPEMNGLEATRAIRARGPAGPQPQIIAMTANALAGDREACLAAGMDDYVAKPIEREQLFRALRRAAAAVHGAVEESAGLAAR